MSKKELLEAIVDDPDHDFANTLQFQHRKAKGKNRTEAFTIREKVGEVASLAVFTGKIRTGGIFDSGPNNVRLSREDMRQLGFFYYLMAKVRAELEHINIEDVRVSSNTAETITFFTQITGQNIIYEGKTVEIKFPTSVLPTVDEAKNVMTGKIRQWLANNPD